MHSGPKERNVGVFLWKRTCFIVEDLHHIQWHLAEVRGKTGKQMKQLLRLLLMSPSLHSVSVYIVCLLTACHSDECFSFSVCLWSSPGPEVMDRFAQYIGAKWKQFLLQKSTEISPAVSICLATTRSYTWPFKQFDQNQGPQFFKGYNFNYDLVQILQHLFNAGSCQSGGHYFTLIFSWIELIY